MNVKLLKDAKMPVRGTRNSAGYDLASLETVTVHPGTQKKIRTGVCVEMPIGIVGNICHRSGMNSKDGVQVSGKVDPDYRGEISVTVFNCHPSKTVSIYKGRRIAQIIFNPIWAPVLTEVEELSVTGRGEEGFGSTGE